MTITSGSALLAASAMVTVCPKTTTTVVVPLSLSVSVSLFPAVTSTDHESTVPAATWGTSITISKVPESSYGTITEVSEELVLIQPFKLLAEIVKVSSKFPSFTIVNV